MRLKEEGYREKYSERERHRERESKREKIERKRIFFLKFLVKSPKRQNKA